MPSRRGRIWRRRRRPTDSVAVAALAGNPRGVSQIGSASERQRSVCSLVNYENSEEEKCDVRVRFDNPIMKKKRRTLSF